MVFVGVWLERELPFGNSQRVRRLAIVVRQVDLVITIVIYTVATNLGVNSNTPMSQATPCGRETPRWSVA